MRPCPTRGTQKLLASGLERSQVGKMLALWALIDAGVELQVNLVDSVCQPNLERSEGPNVGPLSEPHGKAEVEQGPGPGVQPVRR